MKEQDEEHRPCTPPCALAIILKAVKAGWEAVILIDENSASASEITTACLQDHQRVVVIGQRSYGKGSVQDVEILQAGDEEHAIKFTICLLYTSPSPRDATLSRMPSSA